MKGYNYTGMEHRSGCEKSSVEMLIKYPVLDID